MPPKKFLEGKANAAEKQNRSVAKEEIKKLIKKYIPSFDLIVNQLPAATKKGMKSLYDDFYKEILNDIKKVANNEQDEVYVVKQLQDLLIGLFPENNLFQNQLETKSEKEREVKIQTSISPEIIKPEINVSEGMASKVFGVTESKQSTIPQIPNSKIAIQKKFQPEIIPRLAEIKKTEYVPRLNTAHTIANTPVITQSVIPPNENKKITLTELLDAESANLVPKKKIINPTMTGISKRQQERKKRENIGIKSEVSRKNQTLDEFLKENEEQFTKASLVDEKEREVKLPQPEQTMLTGLSNRIKNLNYGALIGMAASYAVLNNNKGMLQYLPVLGASMGSHLFDLVTTSGFTNLMDTFSKFGADPKEIIKDTRQQRKKTTKYVPKKEDEPENEPEQRGKHDEPPRSKKSPDDIIDESKKIPEQKTIDDIKNEDRKYYLNENSTPEEYDAFSVSHGQPPGNRGLINQIKGLLKNGASALLHREPTIDRDRFPDVNIYRDRFPDVNIDSYMDLDDDEFIDPPSAPINDRTPITTRFRDTIDRAESFARSSDSRNKLSAGVAAGAVLGKVVANAVSPNQEIKKDVIKEEPIAYKQDVSDQNDVPTPPGLIRGAGILKPKFIVPSVNIFAKTEQEQFVDDMEFAMFDFVQDDSGGNDPNGTNSILRDQTISKGLRYQRSGVTVNSLYGRDIPNNPNNISKEMMNQLFLGEPILPTMKFLFSEEFYPQEFNQSEFEVSNYDVNNELTAIEMLSPYSNFTNNQLLDQFIDTSILYGIVP